MSKFIGWNFQRIRKCKQHSSIWQSVTLLYTANRDAVTASRFRQFELRPSAILPESLDILAHQDGKFGLWLHCNHASRIQRISPLKRRRLLRNGSMRKTVGRRYRWPQPALFCDIDLNFPSLIDCHEQLGNGVNGQPSLVPGPRHLVFQLDKTSICSPHIQRMTFPAINPRELHNSVHSIDLRHSLLSFWKCLHA